MINSYLILMQSILFAPARCRASAGESKLSAFAMLARRSIIPFDRSDVVEKAILSFFGDVERRSSIGGAV